FDEAIAAYRRAEQHHRLAFAPAPASFEVRSSLSAYLMNLADTRRGVGQPAEAAAAAVGRPAPWANKPPQPFAASSELALCIPLVAKGRTDLTEAERAERRHYADLAMETLRQAVRAGYKDASRLRSMPDLFFLRRRDDFQALLRDLAFPTRPFARP